MVLDRPDWVPASPADRAREALLDDATRSNKQIALAVRSTPAIVARCRKQLTDLGVLPAAPYPRRRFPAHKSLPPEPRSLTEGACLDHPRSDAWTSSDPDDRAFARNVCRWACHVQAECFEFSLSLPVDDRAIWGGGGASDRERERSRRRPGPLPMRLTSRGKNAARDRRRVAARQQREDGAA